MCRCRRIGPIHKAGFSLIELFISISLLAVFLGAVHEAMLVGLRLVHTADDRERARQQVAAVLERFTREVSFANGVDRATDARCQFDTASTNNINYVYASGALTRDTGGSTQTLLSGITALDFNYIDDAGTEYSSCDDTSSCASNCCRTDVRMVRITVTVAQNNETLSAASAAYLRDL